MCLLNHKQVVYAKDELVFQGVSEISVPIMLDTQQKLTTLAGGDESKTACSFPLSLKEGLPTDLY